MPMPGGIIVFARIAAVMMAFALGACSQAPAASSTVGPVVIHASRVKAYHQIRELAADAELIVRARAKTHSLEQVRSRPNLPPTPFTISIVQVTEVLQGSLSGQSELKIRQLGGVTESGVKVVLADQPPLLQDGADYVLFLTRFTYGPGRDTDQFVIVGAGAGEFGDRSGTVTRLDAHSPDLPRRLAMSELKREIGA